MWIYCVPGSLSTTMFCIMFVSRTNAEVSIFSKSASEWILILASSWLSCSFRIEFPPGVLLRKKATTAIEMYRNFIFSFVFWSCSSWLNDLCESKQWLYILFLKYFLSYESLAEINFWNIDFGIGLIPVNAVSRFQLLFSYSDWFIRCIWYARLVNFDLWRKFNKRRNKWIACKCRSKQLSSRPTRAFPWTSISKKFEPNQNLSKFETTWRTIITHSRVFWLINFFGLLDVKLPLFSVGLSLFTNLHF